MNDRLLTPSKITAWLDCAHFLTLRHEVDSGLREHPPSMFGEMAQMLLDKGIVHEHEVMARYRAAGRTVFEVPQRHERETFEHWVQRVEQVLDEGHDVIYQMPFIHDRIRGVADFLERVEDDAAVTYEPVDAKLARTAAKPGHVLQLCFYAEAIAARTARPPRQVHIELGSGRRESIRFDDVASYWRRLRHQLAELVSEPPTRATAALPCEHCAFCEFEQVCDAQWRAADSLVNVARLRSGDRAELEADGVTTIAGLAGLDRPVDGIDPDRLASLVRQASLQVQARGGDPEEPPPFEVLEPRRDIRDVDRYAALDAGLDTGLDSPDSALTGYGALPEPDDGDVFLDFEGHPFWKADVGLFFLFGLIEASDGGWVYRAFWAHDQAQEAQATADLVQYIVQRRREHPGMHVYHYNHTERTALSSLAAQYAVAELDLEQLVATGAFVDLYPIVTGALAIGVESYGLKHVERLTDFRRSHDIDRGAGAVVEYEHWMRDRDESRLASIARYNDDDVRATLAVRDWLVAHRPGDVAWRPPVLEPEIGDADLDARIEALHAFGPGTHEHLMGDLLGYWRRERRVVAADCLRLSMADAHEQAESPSAVARLTLRGFQDRTSPKTGKRLKHQAAVFDFPPQQIDADLGTGSRMIVALTDQKWAFFTLDSLDREAGTLSVAWTQSMIDQAVMPTALVHFPSFPEGAKLTALSDLGDQLLTGDASTAAHAILRNDAPVFQPGEGPTGGLFKGGYAEICDWAPHLDHSFVPVQGPPGTGKTFTGAHIVQTLVRRGLRVGVTAMSHHAIDNLMQEVVERFTTDATPLRAVRKAVRGSVDGVDHIDDNARCATGDYDVIAGTSWLFASSAMRQHPVDVLIIDEAGQLGLADTLAASISATNVILLGDPQQLPQVSQAAHPNRSGVSALEHLLGEDARTFAPERGVLLDVTYRMHPDVCGYISDAMYEGRLASEASCATQTTIAGTGLRWIRAEHDTRSTESLEEAAIVASTVQRLLGTDWTDRNGHTGPLTADEVIVVTPYNDQRRVVEAALGADPVTAGVKVGTVDKFQGRQAAVVLFSMTTSSAAFMPRNADFLFSKNRLNVAISRARCVAYLVCTDELLDARPRDVEQMRLIAALCSFVEQATHVEAVTVEPGTS